MSPESMPPFRGPADYKGPTQVVRCVQCTGSGRGQSGECAWCDGTGSVSIPSPDQGGTHVAR
jgi:hypothetical protein